MGSFSDPILLRVQCPIRFRSAKVTIYSDLATRERKKLETFSTIHKSGRFRLKRAAKVQWLLFDLQDIRK